jgi:hypothetical protein
LGDGLSKKSKSQENVKRAKLTISYLYKIWLEHQILNMIIVVCSQSETLSPPDIKAFLTLGNFYGTNDKKWCFN